MPRTLGLHERYFVARGNIEFPTILAFYAHLNSHYSAEALIDAVRILLARYPLLCCIVANSRTPTPTFEQQEPDVDEILHLNEVELAPEELLLQMLEDGQSFDLERGPLWRVTSFGTRTIGLTIHHVICDGSGARTLFAELLQLLRSEKTPFILEHNLPPCLDATLDLRPSWYRLIRTFIQAVVLPYLPLLLRPTPTFPNPPPISPFLCPSRLLSVKFPPSLVPELKSAGKAHSVNTLHPILHIAALSALRITLKHQFDPVSLPTEAPRSERSASLGHPRSTCNYVSLIRYEPSVSLRTPFWPTCREYAALIHDARQHAEERGLLGMLAYLPNGIAKPDSKGRARTGWEAHLEERLRTHDAYGASLEVSNLGVMEETEPAEVIWAQTPSPVGSAILVNVISTRDLGMTMTIGWRDGAVEEEFVRDFSRILEGILYVIGEQETREDVTISELGMCSRGTSTRE